MKKRAFENFSTVEVNAICENFSRLKNEK